MEYKRFGNKIIVRIDKDEEILEQVKEPTFALLNIKHQSKKHEKKHFYFSLQLDLVPHKLYLTKNAGLHRLSVCLL